jgi:hypothetical protein
LLTLITPGYEKINKFYYGEYMDGESEVMGNKYSGDLDAIDDGVRSWMEKQRRDSLGMKTVAILVLSKTG